MVYVYLGSSVRLNIFKINTSGYKQKVPSAPGPSMFIEADYIYLESVGRRRV